MDLSSQIGTLFMIGFAGPQLELGSAIHHDIVERRLGGVILFNRCLHTPSRTANIVSSDQVHNLCNALQEAAGGRLLIGVDQEGGRVQRLSPAQGFGRSCSAEDMGRSHPAADMTRQQAETTAAMLAAVGINCNFAPVVDCNTTPDNPIIGALGRSFSSDPVAVARHAAIWIEAHRQRGIISCLKHFPGHGSSTADSHLGFVDISSSWDPSELKPYELLIGDNMVDLIMTGHLFNKNLDATYPATLSGAIINGLLRSELGYTGPVISDDMQMRAITDRFGFEEAVCKSLAAGVDMLVFGNNLDYDPCVCKRAVAAVMNGLDRGTVSLKRLREALGRINALKKQIGAHHE